MNLYLRELKKNRKSLMIWAVILIGLIVLLVAFYPTIAKEAETYEKMIESMPEGVSAAFGFGNISIDDVLGYYSVEGFLMVTLLSSMYAIMLSSGILSKEESDKTIEFLLSKPLTRKEIVTSKLFGYLTNIIILNIIITFALFLSLQAVKDKDFSMKTFVLLSLAPFFLQLIFSAIGFLISVFVTKSKKILPMSLGIVLVSYFLGIFSELTDKLEFLKYLSPFKYFEAKNIIPNNEIEMKYVVVMIIINIVCISLAYVFYNRKDITV